MIYTLLIQRVVKEHIVPSKSPFSSTAQLHTNNQVYIILNESTIAEAGRARTQTTKCTSS